MQLHYGPISLEADEAPLASSDTLTGSAPLRRHHGKLPTIELAGVRLHCITESECITHILDELDKSRGGVVITPNLDHVARCHSDESFAALVAGADLVVADGMPLVWASRLQRTPLPQRVAGSDLIWTLSSAAAAAGKSIFLLGGNPGAAESAARILQQRNPSLKIAGIDCPPPGFESDAGQMTRITALLTKSHPDIVFVALGSPKQERLIDQLRGNLPGSWWLGVGVSLSFIAGAVRRAPPWMRMIGLEWMHRLAQEPRRLFKRYIVVGLPFAAGMLCRSAWRGLTGCRPESASARISPAAGEVQEIEKMQTIVKAIETAQAPPERMLRRLKGLVLLAGSVRPTPLSAALGRNLLDLPVDSDHTVLDHWLAHARQVANLAELSALPVRVLVDRVSPLPASAGVSPELLSIQRDRWDFRGTGGLLASIADDYEDDDLILVANAAQILLEDLAAITAALGKTGGDVSLISHQDGTPSGVMLVTCKALRLIPKSGFVDMKEQALPAIAEKYDVRVVSRQKPTGLPIRSLADYIQALRLHHGGARRLERGDGGEDWRPTFSLAQAGSHVDPAARVHDSVVLAGGTVETGAILVRSIVCPGGIVRKDHKAVDQIITPADKRK